MSIATAEQVRSRPILVQVPGTDLQLKCRRPDPLQLIADGVLPLEHYAAVLEDLNGRLQESNVLDNRAPEASTAAEDPKAFMAFVDRWVCAAVVAPRVVLTEDEAVADPTTLWVADLESDLRLEVVLRTNRPLASARLKTAVADFRRQQSAGAGAGSDGAAVREEPLGAAAGA